MNRRRIPLMIFALSLSIMLPGVLSVACRPLNAPVAAGALLPQTIPEAGSSSAPPTITLIPSLIPTMTGRPTAVPPAAQNHFTVLLMGIDARPSRPNLMTDTIMIFDINLEDSTGAVLSIPRDVWFYTETHTRYTTRLEGEPMLQVNRFYALAELAGRGAGGDAIKDAIRRNMGLEIDAYAVIDFQVFVRLINAIGGVDLVLSRPISDPTFPDMNDGYDPLELPAGPIHMDGDLALRYARTRHPDSDVGRILRQQHLLQAVIEKLAQPSAWARLIEQFPQLWLELRSRVDTDLTLEQLSQLAGWVRDLSLDDIRFAALDEPGAQIERRTLDDGSTAWVILPDGATALVREVLRLETLP
ncbi:MAG: LCP family protein [Anaerolineae bacterium]|nr:LCP family protein [Anaerolineae bacterium]